MTPDDPLRHGLPGGGSGLLRYVFVWVLAGAALVAVAAALLRPGSEDDPVSLPPVREVGLAPAARAAGCELRTPRTTTAFNPVAEGPRGSPARPGVYDPAPPASAIVAALRRGVIVIQYRPGIDDEYLDLLEDIQRSVPEGTIVAPNETRMPYEIAVTGWRRLLGCRRATERTLDAMRLFRGRYLGRGPDR